MWTIQRTETAYEILEGDDADPVASYPFDLDEVGAERAARAQALEELASRFAALAEEAGQAQLPADLGTGIHALLTVEDWETEDGRLFSDLQIRDQAVWPFMMQDRGLHGLPGDASTFFAGAFTSIERDPREPTRILAHGNLLRGADGTRAEELIRGGLRGISMDGIGGDVYYDVRKVDMSGFPIDVLERISGTQIIGGTGTPFPAVAPATVWLDDEGEPAGVSTVKGEAPPLTVEPEQVDDGLDLETLLASAGGPDRPPADWFDNPAFGRNPDVDQRLGDCVGGGYGCHLTITDEGRVYGHIATWRTPHMTFAGREVFAPRSTSSTPYSLFLTGEVVCSDGTRRAVGPLAMGCGHASDAPNINAGMAKAFYDNTGTVVADIAVGEDEHGIWCAGALRPHLSEAQIRELIAADVSGDWRAVGNASEMIAVAVVNTGAFPVPRPRARYAAGQLLSLVAAAGPAWVARKGRPALQRAAATRTPRVVVLSEAELEERIRAAVEQALAAAGVEVDAKPAGRPAVAAPLAPRAAIADGLSPRARQIVTQRLAAAGVAVPDGG